MFSHLLVTWGQTTSQKCSKLAPGFLALTPSVKQALISWSVLQVQIIFHNELLWLAHHKKENETLETSKYKSFQTEKHISLNIGPPT
jgi:hypothetical protein